MRKLSKVFVVFVLILTMIMVLGGCTKKDDEEKSSRRERRNRTEKEEDKNSDDEESSIFGQKNDESSSAPMTTAPPAEPATDIPTTAAEDAPTPTEEITPAPTEVITPAPAVPDKYLAEFDTLDDLKFIRSEILGKKLSDVLNTLEKKYNIAGIINRHSQIDSCKGRRPNKLTNQYAIYNGGQIERNNKAHGRA
jgi:hypothetical protein